MQSILALALTLVATSALTVVSVLMLVGAFRAPAGRDRHAATATADAAFLVRDGLVIDANDAGARLLDSLRTVSDRPPAGGFDPDDWETLSRFLATRFPGFTAGMTAIEPAGASRRLSAADGGLDLTLERLSGATRLTLSDPMAEGGTVQVDRLSLRAMQDELALLRHMTEAAPLMMWRETADHRVVWANAAYLRQASVRTGAGAMSWPLPALFPGPHNGNNGRVALAPVAGPAAPAWFDIRRIALETDTLAYALPADEAHRAERTKHDFIQTLTKTFATLPIGLAVFDRTRRLQIFNPALTDLTGLEPEFLLSRPGLEGFLNRMRDKHVLPEPRDWRSWRRRLLEIESTGPSGDFEETWTLATGQTFRVSANPHPDGALAFLVEDITSETHLTRNIRAEMETSQSVLNLMDAAIAVFSPIGQLILTNAAFSRLWTLEGEETLGAVTLAEALDNWREVGGDANLWTRIGALARPGHGDGGPVSGLMRLGDGECLEVAAQRTATGALMIAFTQTAASASPSAQAPTPHRRAQVLRASA